MQPNPLPAYQRATTVPREVTSAFGIRPTNIERLGVGHINETFVVLDENSTRFLLQAINHDVFERPWEVMENLERILQAQASETLHLLTTKTGGARKSTVVDDEERWWRAFPFIGNTVTHTSPRDAGAVYRTARAFGHFQRKMAGLDPSALHETIPRFHDTPHRYAQLDAALAIDSCQRAADCADLLEQAHRHRPLASRLIDLETSGEIPIRVVHNDAKISNVLFCKDTDKAVCVVDFDTVMAGISLFDFGDMVRSMCHTSEEDETDLTKVVAQPKLFDALARGYTESTQGLLNHTERRYLLDAGLVLVLEQGVRFLTDHINGDIYFRTQRQHHNLDRAATQFHLLESLLDQEAELRRL